MEQVNLKNSHNVCENVCSAVPALDGNLTKENYPKIRNGLVNGVPDKVSNKNTIKNQDANNSGVTNNEPSAIYPHSGETSLNHDLDVPSSIYENNSTESAKSKAKHNEKTMFNCIEGMVACSETRPTTELNVVTTNSVCNSEVSESISNTNILVNGTTSQPNDLAVDMHNLNINESISESIGNDTDSAINKLEVLEETQDSFDIVYDQYKSELQMPLIMKIIQKDLSEPYSIYTYRYFLHNWPNLCFLAMCDEKCVGAIVCKLDYHRKSMKRGYIAMLAVDQHYRKQKIGSTLVKRAIQEMIAGNADEVVLETEVTNQPALRLYELLGFVRDKRLFRYYLNGVDALRLKLWLR